MSLGQLILLTWFWLSSASSLKDALQWYRVSLFVPGPMRMTAPAASLLSNHSPSHPPTTFFFFLIFMVRHAVYTRAHSMPGTAFQKIYNFPYGMTLWQNLKSLHHNSLHGACQNCTWSPSQCWYLQHHFNCACTGSSIALSIGRFREIQEVIWLVHLKIVCWPSYFHLLTPRRALSVVQPASALLVSEPGPAAKCFPSLGWIKAGSFSGLPVCGLEQSYMGMVPWEPKESHQALRFLL